MHPLSNFVIVQSRTRNAEHKGSERSERKKYVRGAVATWLKHLKWHLLWFVCKGTAAAHIGNCI